jgi:CCR4-NOT transcription complex subunit 6
MAATASAGPRPRIRVVSYNILSEIYANQQIYPYCDFWALAWTYRCENLVREIKDSAADVLCLQVIQSLPRKHK